MKKVTQIVLSSLAVLFVLKSPAILVEASNGNVSKLEATAEKLNVSVEELENLDELILEAIEQLPTVEMGETVSVKISENLIAESSLMNSPYRFIGSTNHSLEFKNIWGGTVIKLTAYGEFDFGNGTVQAYRGYGTSHALAHTVNIGSATYSGGGSSATISMPFSGAIKLGVGDIGMDLNTFNVTSKITCKSNQTCTGTWYK